VTDKRGIRAVLVDGYMPNFSYLKKMDWNGEMQNSLSDHPDDKYNFRRNVYNKYLNPEKEKPTDKIQSNIHREIADSVKKRFCPYGQARCVQRILPARGTKQIEGIISYETKKRVRDKILPAFTKEIDSDLGKGNENYSFTFMFYDLNEDNHCPITGECTDNWMKVINFKEKGEDGYEDFHGYKKAAEKLLKHYIDGAFKDGWFEKKRKD